MPGSTLDDAIEAFQRSILRGERSTASAMVRAYVQSWKRIKTRLAAMQKDYDKSIASGEPVGLNWIYQNSRLADLQMLIGKELTRFTGFAGTKITAAQKKVIAESLTFSRDEMILQLGPQYDVSDFLRVKSLPTSSIEIMVGINQPDSPLKRLLDRINIESSQSASDALIEGMLLGYNPRKIAPMIRDTLGIQLNRALTISRTEVMRAQRTATEENYKANADVVKGWRWIAEVNGACPVCLAMHGKEFPLTERMSSHINCRCTSAPLTMTWEEIGQQYGLDFSNVDKAGPSFEEIAKKYKMSQEQIARYQSRNITGEAFFRTLSAEDQRRIIGPAKWLAWKEGKFEFEKLSKPTHSAVWGEGKGVASLKDLLGENDANYYLRLAQNGLAKQNLNGEELIKFASLDLRPLTNREIGKITNLVAERGFNDNLLEKAGGRLAGLEWEGNTIKGSDTLGVGVAHYLRHAVFKEEWPKGTSINEYYASLRNVVEDKTTKIFIGSYLNELQISFIRDAKELAGKDSGGTILIEYRPKLGYFVTANQVKTELEIIEDAKRSGIIWIRK